MLRTRVPSPRWIMSPTRDLMLAWAWVPFASAALVVGGDPGLTRSLMAGTFVLSAAHQPLTLPLVYADGEQLRRRPLLFGSAPLVAVAAIVVGLQLSFLLVAVVAGVWNTIHTLQQRYGLTRIYGRKAGQHDGRTDRALLWIWLIVVVASAAASTGTASAIERLGLGARNRAAIDLLSGIGDAMRLALPLLVAAAVVVTVRWVRAELSMPQRNPAKWIYVGSTGALLLVMVVSPVAGFVAYVGAHAVEYFVIVHHRLERQARANRSTVTALHRLTHRGLAPFAAMALFTVTILSVLRLLEHTNEQVFTVTFLAVGALHFVYDSVIWKLRAPTVAARFNITLPR